MLTITQGIAVARNVEVIFEDCVVEFKCPYCGTVWKADSKKGLEYCVCGARYELRVHLKIIP